VSGLPSGPMTYLTLGRWGSVMDTLTHWTDNEPAKFSWLGLKFA
jgi:hypothetical protein